MIYHMMIRMKMMILEEEEERDTPAQVCVEDIAGMQNYVLRVTAYRRNVWAYLGNGA